MIILENKNSNIDMTTLKHIYMIFLVRDFNIRKESQSAGITQLLKLFSDSEVREALNDIYINGNKLCIPETGESSYILRYLEFGGDGVSALHLLSNNVKKLGMIGG